eukprot:5979183-Pyramimonas_sp.AAC.1
MSVSPKRRAHSPNILQEFHGWSAVPFQHVALTFSAAHIRYKGLPQFQDSRDVGLRGRNSQFVAFMSEGWCSGASQDRQDAKVT